MFLINEKTGKIFFVDKSLKIYELFWVVKNIEWVLVQYSNKFRCTKFKRQWVSGLKKFL